MLLSRQSLAKRWDFASTKAIESYEAQGIITRVPNLPTPRYSLEEIERIEMVDKINPLSPIERKRLERRIEQLEVENAHLKNKLDGIRQVIA